MDTHSATGLEDSSTDALSNEVVERLSRVLRPCITRWIYSYNVPSWRGQEDDVVEDVLQDMFERLIKQMKKIKEGLAAPITSLDAMSYSIARNCCRDRRRKDQRLRRFPEDNYRLDDLMSRSNWVDPGELAIENMYTEWLFLKLSFKIARFSTKKRTALLIDLSNLMDFQAIPTPLQKAFLENGIKMRDYQGKYPVTPKEKGRHSSLLSGAYKQVRHDAHSF
jgi:DNA-directed RNA polymerase specialized sigma24 family protein